MKGIEPGWGDVNKIWRRAEGNRHFEVQRELLCGGPFPIIWSVRQFRKGEQVGATTCGTRRNAFREGYRWLREGRPEVIVAKNLLSRGISTAWEFVKSLPRAAVAALAGQIEEEGA